MDENLSGPIISHLGSFKVKGYTLFFYRQLDFPSEPEVANEILENEAKSCLAVA